ncbi:Target of rapamycin complex 2 subunit mapkap1 [Desmophyllum pertusum]|uniref:Target of rapamycin complex 2 subunit MAPKAP1 n=1 Tax=Desmophyllum pertusum TaxID=174260 RepID=A0A9W9YRZ3_9CNID|nr:Target of rapamycin complex 2 subunit mapkap1 [Desmophyllum pertusum]
MAFIDDPEFVIAHIRHSCVITDDTGMCEQVIMNEEFENEKAIKHRRRVVGKYSVDRDSLDFPSYPQSFDIAVSPDLSQRNSKSQGKGDHNRRERNREVRCTTVSWKEGQNSVLSGEDLLNVFTKREYSKYEGEAYQGTCVTKKLKIFLTMLPEEERAIPMIVTVLGTACVQDLIGLIMYKYTNEGLEPQLKNDVKSFCLQIAEDDGEVDTDFPALDNKEAITKFGFTCLALVQKDASPAKPTPPKPSSGIIVTVHEPQHGFSRVKVDSMKAEMKQVFEKMVKKRGLRRTANEYVLEKHSEFGVPISLESSLESMGTMEFCLVRFGRKRVTDVDKEGDAKQFDFYANYQYRSYRVSMLQKLRTVTEIQLGVSHEKIEIDPVLQPKSAKKFWGKQKFTSVEMENVVGCDLMEEKSNGKAIFRIVYFSQNAHDFKHYDFETESDDAGEIVKKVNHIIKSNMSGKRSEYLSSKEKKLEKRKSLR